MLSLPLLSIAGLMTSYRLLKTEIKNRRLLVYGFKSLSGFSLRMINHKATMPATSQAVILEYRSIFFGFNFRAYHSFVVDLILH